MPGSRTAVATDEAAPEKAPVKSSAEAPVDELDVFEQMLESVAVYDRDARILYANEATGRLFGRAREELLGQVLWELFPEAVGNPFYQAFQRSLATGRIESFEHHFSHWDQWFMNHIYPSRRGLCVVATDITAQKRALARLEVLALAARAFAATGPDLATTVSTVARTLGELVGDTCVVRLLAADGLHLDVVAHFSTDPVAHELVERVVRRHRTRVDDGSPGAQAFRSGEPVLAPLAEFAKLAAAEPSVEYGSAVLQLSTTSAMAFPMAVRGQAVGALTMGRTTTARAYDDGDVSLMRDLAARASFAIVNAQLFEAQQEARRAAEEAADQAERLQRLTEALSGAVTSEDVARLLVHSGQAALGAAASFAWLLTPDGESFELVNSEGYDGPRLTPFQRFPASMSLPVCEATRTCTALLFGSLDEMQERFPATIAKTPSPFKAWAVVPLVVQGRGVGSVSLSFAHERGFSLSERRLITAMASQASLAFERCRLYESVRQALSLANEADRRKDDFLAMLGHELRNPLAPILTAVELVRMRGVTTADRELGIIDRQARHLVRLVDDLLDVSRITRGKLTLARAPMELSAAIAKALETTSTLIRQRRHTVTLDVPKLGLVLLADEIRLSQVFANLLGNAAKYTPAGGHIEVVARSRGHEVAVTVRDDGTGIAPELLPLVFDPFLQGERAIDRSDGGLGLGLSLVRSLVALHEGRVAAHSGGPGRGSTFEVVLPLLPAAELATLAAAVVARSSQETLPGRRRVLIVDDNQDAAELLTEALAQLGHDVRMSTDPLSALVLTESFVPQVAVLDIGLPVMDGYELGAKLRERFGAAITLIAATGYGQASDRARSSAAGFDAHLLKPIDFAELIETLARAR